MQLKRIIKNNKMSLEQEILHRIKAQENPNGKIQKHIRLLKYFWASSCLFSILIVIMIYNYPNEFIESTNNYHFLIYLPTLFVIILIFLGFRFQELKMIEFKNKSKFKKD